MRRSYLWALLIALAVIGWMASGQFTDNDSDMADAVSKTGDVAKTDEVAGADEPIRQLTIKAMSVINEKTELTVRASGVTRTSFAMPIINRRADIVTKVTAKEASWVKKGDIILELGRGTLEADLAAATADRQAAYAAYQDAKRRFSADGTLAAQLNAAETELAALKATYNSTKQLVARGLQTELTLSNQRAQLTAAETRLFELQSLSEETEIAASYAAMTSVDARIALLQEQLSFTTIRAPQDGWLEDIHVEQGEFINHNSHVAQLLGLQELALDVPIPQARIKDVSIGDEAEVEIIGGGIHQGVVSKIASIANDATRTFTIEISLANDKGALLAGMSAEASVTIGKVDAYQISPAHLNVDEDGQLTVKTVSPQQTVEILPVELVRTTGNMAYISGLQDGTIVLAAGQAFLSKGESVKYDIVTDEEGS